MIDQTNGCCIIQMYYGGDFHSVGVQRRTTRLSANGGVSLFHGNGLGQVAGLIHVGPLGDRHVIGE